MTQTPKPEDFLLKWRGDTLTVTLELDTPRRGRAAFRTNIGGASIRRREIIDETEKGVTPLARAWTDIPLKEVAPGKFSADIVLKEVGIFSGKACFFPEGSKIPEWPEGRNTHVKVESAETRKNNSIYCVFPRQFGSFREIVRRLPVVMDRMGFRIIQTLPPFPVPTTYAVMGEYGCPFAATDFLSVDPAMAEFDEYATPLDQFKELIGAVHAKKGLFLIDLPANHTGWASTLQTHHPDWFHRQTDGKFISPGAWGVTWADLVELDYSNSELRAYMADVFLFWCRNGVDGFRCDAGYMIPAETWEYIVARVREEYPDTVFMLEGLGGRIEVTDRLLAESNLDWAYSEIFQTYDRGQFESYLPGAIARSEKFGTLVHFAETHDNDRLAKGGTTYARLRVQLAALLSWQGAWGIANGVEWFCREKIDVHGKNNLNWGADENMVGLISRLNRLLRTHPSFSGPGHLEVVTRGGGNTLAVIRQSADDEESLLVLANLDCENPAAIDWDRGRFAITETYDFVTGRKVNASGPVELAPGEVLCLRSEAETASPREETPLRGGGVSPAQNEGRLSSAPDGKPTFHVVMPRDAKRDVVVPQGLLVEISAPTHFRMRLIDAETGKTVRVRRSGEGNSVIFDAPNYHGDGTGCRPLHLDMTIYEDGRAIRSRSRFFVPPTPRSAKFRVSLDREDVRLHPEYRTVLSNGAGAASQMRIGWGVIRSQYDAILAANPNPSVPSDRINLWARTRCWLQREGYTRELDSRCITRFTADPAGRFARWIFTVPCGMGKETMFMVTLAVADGRNVAEMRVERLEAKAREVGGHVRLVFRPDIEWRSFHATTKAYQGLDSLFPSKCQPIGAGASSPAHNGFDFHPYDGHFNMSVTGGAYHHEPQWTYGVGHPDEAERGQEGSGDLFSPGWISADLAIGDAVSIVGAYTNGEAVSRPLQEEEFPSAGSDQEIASPLSFAQGLRRALELYIVRRDDLKTVIAGYPWFLDWGRDTFIFMRGMIAAGMTADALKILKAFAAFEENGTLPNIIYGKTAGNRDTTDAPLWFIRCVQEVAGLDGLERLEGLEGRAGWEDIVKACASIVEHYITGTPNGIHMDPESALVWSPSHFTWMDTNYPACTPRIGYPVEIQALWISALKFVGRVDLVQKAMDSLLKYFKWEYGFRDCLAAPNGEPAAQATPEDTIRPNQLLLVTLGVLLDRSILRATEELLTPCGIRSLNAEHPLYHGTYTGDEDTSRKPAYHNGTVWAWQFPLYAEAMQMTGLASRESALSLLAGAVESLNSGCIGHVSEIADGDTPHVQKGCLAQAWSDSEFLRVWLKLGGK